MKETVMPDESETTGVDQLPVVIACDVGQLDTPEGYTFGALRVLWANAAEYESGQADHFTTLILPTVNTVENLIKDLNEIVPNLTPDITEEV